MAILARYPKLPFYFFCSGGASSAKVKLRTKLVNLKIEILDVEYKMPIIKNFLSRAGQLEANVSVLGLSRYRSESAAMMGFPDTGQKVRP